MSGERYRFTWASSYTLYLSIESKIFCNQLWNYLWKMSSVTVTKILLLLKMELILHYWYTKAVLVHLGKYIQKKIHMQNSGCAVVIICSLFYFSFVFFLLVCLYFVRSSLPWQTTLNCLIQFFFKFPSKKLSVNFVSQV
jgi:hypothetical protein